MLNLYCSNYFRKIIDEKIREFPIQESHNNPEVLCGYLISAIQDAADQAIPKFINISAKSYPYYILNLIKERRRKKMDREYNLDKKAVLKVENNKKSKEFKKAVYGYTQRRWKFFLDKLGPHPASTREFWKTINKTRSQKKSGEIPTLKVDDKVYKTDEEKANLFGSILSETFAHDGSSTEFDTIVHDQVKQFVEEFDYSDSNYPAVSFLEMVGVLKKLKMGSSPGEDGIHNEMLINLPSRGLDLLLKLTNASLVHGLPSCLKTAIITMIPKKESSSPLPSDYRPISLTSCVGKFIERIVRNRLYKFLEEKKLIIKEQSGFRSKRGTADNLVFITQKIQECINREKKVCGIFFDISKAFDRAWHYGIVFKLVKIGAPIYLVRFVKYFLSDRSFRVK